MDPELSTIKRCIAIILKQFDYKKRELCSKPLKELVTTIRKVEGIVPAFIDVLFEHLRREDSDLRLAILLIANHFFQRSHNFRLELINSIQDFLVYVLETDPLHYQLPKPAEAANILKKEAMVTLRYWIEKFGAGYAKLQKLENFLKNSKSLDWENSAAELQIDRERAAQEDFHKAVKARKIVEQVSKLYGEFRPEIERLQLEADTVVELLFPHFCPIGTHLNGKELAQAQGSSIHDQLHAFGTSNSGGITICLNAKEVVIENTPDNADLINQVKDTTKQLDKWQSKLGKWIAKLTEAGDSSSLMRQLIDAKRNMCERLQKCKEFVFPMPRNGNVEEESDSADDSDFVDVEEKEGYEPEFVEEDEQCKPSTSQCHHFGPRPSIPIPNKSRGKSVEAVQAEKKPVEEEGPPRLTMGLDLKYWGQSEVKPAQRTRNQVGDDSFWNPANSDDNNAPTEDMESYRSRQITFIGKMPAIEKMCRAPLPSGRLCPRMERHRCALHGLIVDRDEQGFPVEEQSCAKSKKISDREKQRKELEEREYLQDLEEATGAKLRLPEKKTTGGRTARPREKSENVKSRERLKSKLFDKRALKRVSATLEQIQKARAERNFAHQFNYAVTRR